MYDLGNFASEITLHFVDHSFLSPCRMRTVAPGVSMERSFAFLS